MKSKRVFLSNGMRIEYYPEKHRTVEVREGRNRWIIFQDQDGCTCIIESETPKQEEHAKHEEDHG